MFDFKYDGPGPGKGGTGVFTVDGKEFARKTIPHTIPILMSIDETFDIGSDTRTGVDDSYKLPFRFTGTIDKLTYKLGPNADDGGGAEGCRGYGRQSYRLAAHRRQAVRNARLPCPPNAMSRLLKVTALIEAVTGLGLIAVPALVVRLLLGAEIFGASIPLGRVAGVALLALGVACWLARCDEQSRAAKGLVSAMMLYNMGAMVILGAAGICAQPVGIALWPAVILHAAMAVWCVKCLWHGPC